MHSDNLYPLYATSAGASGYPSCTMWLKVRLGCFFRGNMPTAARSLGIESFLVPAAIVGDITPNDGISKEEKRRLEANAIVRIQEMLGPGSAAGSSYSCTPAL